MLLQDDSYIIITTVCLILNIKEHGKSSFPASIYVITTKANV